MGFFINLRAWRWRKWRFPVKGEPKLNVIFTPKGLERVSILGGVNLTLEAMELYRTIARDVMEIDKKIRKGATGKRPVKV